MWCCLNRGLPSARVSLVLSPFVIKWKGQELLSWFLDQKTRRSIWVFLLGRETPRRHQKSCLRWIKTARLIADVYIVYLWSTKTHLNTKCKRGLCLIHVYGWAVHKSRPKSNQPRDNLRKCCLNAVAPRIILPWAGPLFNEWVVFILMLNNVCILYSLFFCVRVCEWPYEGVLMNIFQNPLFIWPLKEKQMLEGKFMHQF